MNVVIAGIPAARGEIDPALEPELQCPAGAPDLEGNAARDVLGPAGGVDGVGAGGQADDVAVGAVDLGLKVEVRREPLSGRWIQPSLRIADRERRRRRLAAFVEDAQPYLGRRQDAEEDRRVVAEADVLRALPDVGRERCFALPGVTAVELQDAVFDRESGERRQERRLVEQLQIEPAVGDVARRDRLLRPRAHAESAAPAREDAKGLRARDAQGRGHAGLVAHLDEKRAPALLDELGARAPLCYVDAAFGIDMDVEEAVAVEDFLDA